MMPCLATAQTALAAAQLLSAACLLICCMPGRQGFQLSVAESSLPPNIRGADKRRADNSVTWRRSGVERMTQDDGFITIRAGGNNVNRRFDLLFDKTDIGAGVLRQFVK